jgi:hypothetical protein
MLINSITMEIVFWIVIIPEMTTIFVVFLKNLFPKSSDSDSDFLNFVFMSNQYIIIRRCIKCNAEKLLRHCKTGVPDYQN